jgi:hypothetical protein
VPYIDFSELRQRIKISRVLHEIQYRAVWSTPSRAFGPCPLHCCPSVGPRFWRRCCSFDLEADLWFCHNCKLGGNALDLYARVRHLTVYHAALELCRILEIPVPTRPERT